MGFSGFMLILFLCSGFTGCSSEDAEVSCAIGLRCLLPCSFKTGPYISIHWRKYPGDALVISYYNKKEQLNQQHQDYDDRAFLGLHVQKGNASLLLWDVRVEDEGRYVCFSSTSGDSSISNVNLKVFVRSFEVDLVKRDSELICRSEGLYPEPAVSWSAGLSETEAKTTVYQREDRLFDIYSSLTLQATFTVYSCNVSTAHFYRSTEMTEEYPVGVFYNDAVLLCPLSKTPTEGLIWKFNHTQKIVSRTGSKQHFNKSWRPLVDALTQSNSLVLKDLTWDQEGHYSCHIRTEQQTSFSVVYLRIQLVQQYRHISEDIAADLDLIIFWFVSAVIIFGFSACCFKTKGHK